MNIGIIGAGQVGTTLGRGLTRAGHSVTYAQRDPGRAPPYAGAATASPSATAAAAEVLLLATPFHAAAEALRGAGDLRGRVLIDVTNPLGPGLALTVGHQSSGAEQIAALAPGAQVVKAFNTTGIENMADPRYGAQRAVMFLCGDDAAAKETTARLAEELGFEAVSVGPLARARLLEPAAVLWIDLALRRGHGRNIAYGLLRRQATDAAPTVPARTPRRIAIIGSGHIGGALAQAFVRAGNEVTLGVRTPGEAPVAGAQVAAIERAAQDAAVIVLAVPAAALPAVCHTLGDVRGKVVVNCVNAIGKGGLVYGHTTSQAEQLQALVPTARVVESFNQQGVEVLLRPHFGGAAASNFVAGDDAEARATVLELSEQVGLESIDAGPLAAARLLEPLTLLWIAAAQALGTREFGLKLLRRG